MLYCLRVNEKPSGLDGAFNSEMNIPYFPLSEVLPSIQLLPPTDFCVRRISLSRIIPTQDRINIAILNHYRQRVRMTDSEGCLPFGVRFANCPMVYLTNGHHRWRVCAERGRGYLRLLVFDYPLPLLDTVLELHKNRARPVLRTVRQIVHPPQLQLSLQ